MRVLDVASCQQAPLWEDPCRSMDTIATSATPAAGRRQRVRMSVTASRLGNARSSLRDGGQLPRRFHLPDARQLDRHVSFDFGRHCCELGFIAQGSELWTQFDR